MALMKGTGPFGRDTEGVFNFRREGPAHVLYWEPCPWRVRAELCGVTVADSRRVRLLHETGLLPVYYFPLADVRPGLLEASDRRTRCPFKGEARYWSVRAGDRLAEDAVWSYPDPIDGAPPLRGHAAFYWDKMDRWLEEDREAFVHARDPHHRIDVMPSSRRVEVSFDGTTLAASERPHVLFETGLRPRYYLPPEDVRVDLLEASATITRCPYKGTTSRSWSFEGPGGRVEDVAWCYDAPLPAAVGIAGRVCFPAFALARRTAWVDNGAMSMDREALARRLGRRLEARPEILEAYLFGSRARDDEQPHSDVDLAVYVDPGQVGDAPYGYAAELGAEMAGLLHRNDVDVVVLNRAPPLLYHRVLRDGVRLFARDTAATTTREGRALSRYCDYVPHLRKIDRAHSSRIDGGGFGR